MLFLDSDAIPEPGWLGAMRAGFDQPDVAIVGARVLPAWPRRPPLLIDSATARDWISMFDLGEEPLPVPRVMGTSYALDRARMGDAPFDEALGRRPGVDVAHEEVQLAIDAAHAGWRCWYAPGAVVHHHIGRERTTWRFMQRRAFTAGRELALHPDDRDSSRCRARPSPGAITRSGRSSPPRSSPGACAARSHEMRILGLTNFLPPLHYGYGAICADAMGDLAERGHDVEMLVAGGGEELAVRGPARARARAGRVAPAGRRDARAERERARRSPRAAQRRRRRASPGTCAGSRRGRSRCCMAPGSR